MIVLILSFCTFSNIIYVYSQSTDIRGNDVEGYYWRDFYGDIPSDALPGGYDSIGNLIYIGQVFAGYLIPAKIRGSDKQVFYEYGGNEHRAIDNIKILCTRHPEQFEWIQTSTRNIKSLTHKNLVNGGFEPTCKTYIGRVKTQGELLVGKVLSDHILYIFEGLFVTKNGKTEHHTSYEILAFNKVLPPPVMAVDIPASSLFLDHIDLRSTN